MSSKRVFGFSGIMFVDYVALALVICVPLIIYQSNRIANIILYGLSLLFGVAMLLTKTRGVWVASFSAIIFILLYSLIKREKLLINKKKILLILFILSLTFTSVYFIMDKGNNDLSSRINQTVVIDQEKAKEGVVTNSLVTRIFIWDTAWNAFKAHPFIGIGAYSFMFSSKEYHNVEESLYNNYVKGLTPHETFLMVLTETGILGLICFLFLLYQIIKMSNHAVNISSTKEEHMFSMFFLSANIYIICSMIITDAWLWGRGIILWGIIVAFTFINLRYLQNKKSKTL
jgi:O-antigen ligase